MPDRAPWATPVLKHSIRRSLRTGLGGVWVHGALPPGGAVLAPNHNSWWDGYVMRELAWFAGADFCILTVARQLERFPFLRRMGALEPGRVREAARMARGGANAGGRGRAAGRRRVVGARGRRPVCRSR